MNRITRTFGSAPALGIAAVVIVAASAFVLYAQFRDDSSQAASLVPTAGEYAETAADADRAFLEAADDGEIDDGEYRQALEAARACMDADGIDARIVEGEGLAPDTLEAPIPAEGGLPENGPDPEVAAVVAECQREHMSHVLRARHLQEFSDPTARAEGFAIYSECIREQGIPLAEDFTHATLQAKLYDAYEVRSGDHVHGAAEGPVAEAGQFMVASAHCNHEVEKQLGFEVY